MRYDWIELQVQKMREELERESEIPLPERVVESLVERLLEKLEKEEKSE